MVLNHGVLNHGQIDCAHIHLFKYTNVKFRHEIV